MMTRVGPGTPAGEMLRRYWWPIGFTEEVLAKGLSRRVRLLGQDLVLFRDGRRQPGLLALHCSHRGTALDYGRVDDAGIRCCYHGWLYDVSGRCIEQPAEPEDSTLRQAHGRLFKDRVRHLPAVPLLRQVAGGDKVVHGEPATRQDQSVVRR